MIPQLASDTDATGRNLAVAAHLGQYTVFFLPLVAPLVIPIFILATRPSDEFVRQHAIESLNFQISMWIWGTVFGLLSILLVGIPFLLALMVLSLVVPALAALEAANGRHYEYPLTLRLIH